MNTATTDCASEPANGELKGCPPRVVLPLGLSMDEVKYRYVTAQLEYLGYRDLTARSLRIGVGTLYKWLARWKFKFPRGLTRAQAAAQTRSQEARL